MSNIIGNLSISEGFWSILALDHGLTSYKDAAPVSAIPELLANCEKNIGSVVMTYGMARYNAAKIKIPTIIQCFGGPFNHPKVQICGVDDALRVGAVGVSVQVDFGLDKTQLAEQIHSIANFVCYAHKKSLPVLFMIAPRQITNFSEFAEPIRFCQELGADLIKIRCDMLKLKEETAKLKFDGLLKNAPPVLLAGGEVHEGILSEMAVASEVGFSGYCIGRNIFCSNDPAEMSCRLNRAWYDEEC